MVFYWHSSSMGQINDRFYYITRLSSLTISSSNFCRCELYVFGDASEKGYCVVISQGIVKVSCFIEISSGITYLYCTSLVCFYSSICKALIFTQRWKTFVSNRKAYIQGKFPSSSWFYVSTSQSSPVWVLDTYYHPSCSKILISSRFSSDSQDAPLSTEVLSEIHTTTLKITIVLLFCWNFRENTHPYL